MQFLNDFDTNGIHIEKRRDFQYIIITIVTVIIIIVIQNQKRAEGKESDSGNYRPQKEKNNLRYAVIDMNVDNMQKRYDV